ncbi:MAG: family 1 glycosylhydrolase [Nitrospiraceae bacterium]|nr:family 1 glycosylhydrolase [Nitrospiraceae bacterium]
MEKGFLWGAATSAFQLEGSASADWAAWDPSIKERPEIINHYTLYKDDILLLKSLGLNAYRFSVEWSRVEPREGQWDEEALDHYLRVAELLRENNIEPMVTLHHFTHPDWFTRKYAWHEPSSVEKFLKFAEKIITKIKNVRYWTTFNEPYVLMLGGYIEGCMPPGLKDVSLAVKALKNMLTCHAGAYDMIHGRTPGAMVSVAHNMAAIVPWNRWNPADRLLSRIGKYFYGHSLIDAFMTGELKFRLPLMRPVTVRAPIKGKLDFMGVNYYTRVHLRSNPFKRMCVELRHKDIGGHGLTDLGWEIHPDGLERVLKYASRLRVPIIITENGIATHDEEKKTNFIRMHVDVMEECIGQGLDIRGYFYWSLIDNYEWLQGLDARFGLYRVDFESKDLRRTPTPAAEFYSRLIKKASL